MDNQTDKQARSVALGHQARSLKQSYLWQVIDKELSEHKGQAETDMALTNDPSTVLACVRKKDGIMLIYEVIDRIISDGDKAEH